MKNAQNSQNKLKVDFYEENLCKCSMQCFFEVTFECFFAEGKVMNAVVHPQMIWTSPSLILAFERRHGQVKLLPPTYYLPVAEKQVPCFDLGCSVIGIAKFPSPGKPSVDE